MQLKMYRAPMLPPEIAMPEGFSIRTICEETEGALWCIASEGGLYTGELTQEAFNEKMGDTASFKGGVYVAFDPEGNPAGTATAQVKPGCAEGTLHMVSVNTSHRGLGLSAPICAAVLKHHWAHGHPDCNLTTDDWRIPAIKSYLKLGFVPVLWDTDMRDRWTAVGKELGLETLPCVEADYSPAEPIVCGK